MSCNSEHADRSRAADQPPVYSPCNRQQASLLLLHSSETSSVSATSRGEACRRNLEAAGWPPGSLSLCPAMKASTGADAPRVAKQAYNRTVRSTHIAAALLCCSSSSTSGSRESATTYAQLVATALATGGNAHTWSPAHAGTCLATVQQPELSTRAFKMPTTEPICRPGHKCAAWR